LVRVKRTPSERAADDLAGGAPLGRYRCANLACGWQGLLPRTHRVRASATGHRRWTSKAALPLVASLSAVPWARAGSVLLVMALLALTGVQGARHLLVAPPLHAQTPVPAGESDDGMPLPAQHPWVRPVAVAASASAPSARTAAATSGSQNPAGSEALASDATMQAIEPLAMRRGCAWGQPGRSPYRGTVEQALVHARLPPEVVHEVARRVQTREVSDRLEIRTGRIHGVQHGREFDPQRVALTFGHSLCLNSRVNFVPGHVERADLYEVRDARGLRHAVMVPDVCGNVSVLGARGERRRGLMAAGDPETDEAWWALATAATLSAGGSVPEPGSLAVALLGLAALGWTWRRRGAAVPRSRGSAGQG
jgi:hypothetical protein